VTTSGEPLPKRGEVWWIRMDKRRPAVVMQSDAIGDPRVRTFLVVPLTSRLHLAGLPGTVRLEHAATGLPRASVAKVYDVQKALRSDFLERAGRLPGSSLDEIAKGLRLVLGL
jgi:mRNA interferase MazF